MNIEDVWNSPGNEPSAVERDVMVAQAREELRRIQRRRVAFVVRTAIALTAVTGLAAYLWATRPAEIAAAWPLHLLLLAQWSVLVLFLREMLSGGRVLRVEASIRESLERLWREAENSRRGQLVVLALFAAAAPLILAAIVQLRESGKMAPHEARSAGILFGAVLAVSTTVILVRRYLIVLPRHRRLSALLQQYRSE